MTAPVSSTLAGANARSPERRRVEEIVEQMRYERSSWIGHWTDIAQLIKPRRGRFFTTDANRGERRNQRIIDSTPTKAARTLAAGMMSGITNPASGWFRLTTPDPELAELDTVKQWLHLVTQRLETVFLRSNWYNVLPVHYMDLGVFGTAAMSIEEDDEDVIRCQAFPLGSYFIGNDHKGRVRMFAREFQMRVRQMVEQFCTAPDGSVDLAPLSEQARVAYQRNEGETMVNVGHLVCPNREYDGSREGGRFKRFASYYYEIGNGFSAPGGGFLKKSGYNEFPVLASRWEVTGEDTYATDCPGMTALGDIRQLQLGEKRIFQGIEKMISPPMQAPSGLRNNRTPISFAANDLSYTTHSGEGVKPMYEIKPQLEHLEMKQDQCRRRINEDFFADLFLMIAQDKRAQRATAREIEERHEEKLLALGPVLEQLNQDLLNPAIDRVFAIMERRGMLPPAPEEMQGVQLRVEYISLMAAAQKMVGVGGMERLASNVIRMASESGNLEMLDKFDFDQWTDEYAGMLGTPPRVVRSDDAVEKLRAGRAAAQQRVQDAEAAKLEAEATAKLASADTSRKNALTDLLGLGGGLPGSPGVVGGEMAGVA